MSLKESIKEKVNKNKFLIRPLTRIAPKFHELISDPYSILLPSFIEKCCAVFVLSCLQTHKQTHHQGWNRNLIGPQLWLVTCNS